ncbi:arginase family protein [Legionella spiritensis]|uniref:histone deacetylase n=1 Tax=Legionella spiritensis TaxID=452 RepID=A0A0W0YXX3_LEGSP|nr:hypothetical protein [Legionella spiritensis]KTD61744.1 acetylpolyamine aminohydrolase [Legionella spiritensis]SNV38647.1 acetylpolyamine aminohydolase [Legionella spiritensis]
MDEKCKKWLLLTIDCCMKEAAILCNWVATYTDKHNRALLDRLRACGEYFSKIERHDSFPELSTCLRETVHACKKKISRNYIQVNKLFMSEKMDRYGITYQIPCKRDIDAMKGFCAGYKDDQQQRLQKISRTLAARVEFEKLVETRTFPCEKWLDTLPWEILFQAIRGGDPELVQLAFDEIPGDNLLLQSLLKVHSRDYLWFLISQCVGLSEGAIKEVDVDVVCGRLTFEVLIQDLITTITQRRAINVCFGLPTHHAYRERAAGFCMINKTAVVMVYEQLMASKPFKAIVIGTDVNRDDGLSAILMGDDFKQNLLHLDAYDSRVYPWHKEKQINEIIGCESYSEPGVSVWSKEGKRYLGIDLSRHARKNETDYHPALLLILSQLKTALEEACLKKSPVILFLPTGWDSHHEEQAPCSKWLNQKQELTPKQSSGCRFTDRDMTYFNRQLMILCQDYKPIIQRIYWQLEGGYTDEVNFRQIACLTECLQSLFLLNDNEVECSEKMEITG